MRRCDIITVKKLKDKFYICTKSFSQSRKLNRKINMIPNGENQGITNIGNNIPDTQKQLNWAT